jgi:biopolymer transport protein ExbD
MCLPATSFALGPQRNAQIVSLTAAPSPAIYYRDQKVSLVKLLEYLDANKAAERSLIIKADRHAPVGLRDELANEALKRGYAVLLAGDVTAR